MTCEQALELMSARLDGELLPGQAEALEAHLRDCPDCKRTMEALEGLETKLSGLREPAPEGLKKGVLYRIDQATGKAKKPGRRWFGPGTAIGAVAAILVLLVGLGVFPQLTGRRAGQESGKANALPADTATRSAGIQIPELSPPPEAEQEPAAEGPMEPQPAESFNPPLSTQKGVYNQDSATASADFAETEVPEIKPDDYYLNGGGDSEQRAEPAPVTKDQETLCGELSKNEKAMVLLYSEFTAETLFPLLEAEEPALWERVKALEATEYEGMACYAGDCGTVLAVHEWLLSNLPQSEMMSSAARAAEMQLTVRMEELDPGSGSLYRIITWSPPDHPVPWPETWPAGWALRFRTEENWALFFPEEGYTPNAGKVAYLAFVQ